LFGLGKTQARDAAFGALAELSKKKGKKLEL
jgi:hypothetical protein